MILEPCSRRPLRSEERAWRVRDFSSVGYPPSVIPIALFEKRRFKRSRSCVAGHCRSAVAEEPKCDIESIFESDAVTVGAIDFHAVAAGRGSRRAHRGAPADRSKRYGSP